MAEACYSARALTKAQVVAKIAKLSFKKNDNGLYTHTTIATLARGIKRIMKGTYNPCDTGKGMNGLLIPNAPLLQKQCSRRPEKPLTKRQRQQAQQQPDIHPEIGSTRRG